MKNEAGIELHTVMAWQCIDCKMIIPQYRNSRRETCPNCGDSSYTPVEIYNGAEGDYIACVNALAAKRNK
jgi:predicted RNA-binding Zn-ribbon protein involved in translation (DUF1610 family)